MERLTYIFVLLFIFQGIKSMEYQSPEPYTNLKLVATADGKAFFADRNETRSWYEAGEYCDSVNMKLASITSRNQSDALQEAYDMNDFRGSFWTSGRDAQVKGQFSWNDTGEALPNFIGFYQRQDLPYQTCVYYCIISETSAELGFYACSFKYYTLCENS